MLEYIYDPDPFLRKYLEEKLEKDRSRIDRILKTNIDENRVEELAKRYSNIETISNILGNPFITYDLEKNKSLFSGILERIPNEELRNKFTDYVYQLQDIITRDAISLVMVDVLAKVREKEGRLTYYI